MRLVPPTPSCAAMSKVRAKANSPKILERTGKLLLEQQSLLQAQLLEQQVWLQPASNNRHCASATETWRGMS